MLPVLVWNAANDWVSFKHVGVQAAGQTGSGIRWLGPLTFVGEQFAFLIGVWFVVWTAAVWSHRRTPDPARAFLWWGSLPVWGFFALASAKASGQLNWPATAYVTGFVLAVAWIRDQLNGPYRKPVARLVSFGVAARAGAFDAHSLPRADAPRRWRPSRVRSRSTSRHRSASTTRRPGSAGGGRSRRRSMCSATASVPETGQEAVVAGTVWNVPGELGVYCKGHPPTFSFGLAMGDRHSQYDLWHPNPVSTRLRKSSRAGRSCSWGPDSPPTPGSSSDWNRRSRWFIAKRGVPVAVWWVWVGYGFRGFPEKSFSDRRY